MELITLKNFNNEIDASICSSFLESKGIENFVFNNFSSTIYPVFNNTIGGVELKVKKEDVETAIAILEEY